MYKTIIAALDGSPLSNLSMDAALNITVHSENCKLTACHVYASRLHRTRFEEMEPGLPNQYHEEERLNSLRDTHEDLISEGMQLISDAYLSPIVQKAKAFNITVNTCTPEGHHYVKILETIREQHIELTVIGASGHGYVQEESLGSLTERLLLLNNIGDILVIRKPWQFKNKPILVGIDGSPNSIQALRRAVELAQIVDTSVEAIAVYDPYFHSTVFKAISDSLPEKDAEKFNFTAQEKLHDEIIDRGLETLYKEGLRRATLVAKVMGCLIHTELLSGKVYSQLYHHACLRNAGLIVMGRYGLHQEKESLIGSNSSKLSRLTNTNFLIVHPPLTNEKEPLLEEIDSKKSIKWDHEAEIIAQRIPLFVRQMAKKAIEARALEQGLDHVTVELVMQSSTHISKKNNE